MVAYNIECVQKLVAQIKQPNKRYRANNIDCKRNVIDIYIYIPIWKNKI
jgi:hypothetical protein